MSTRRVLVDVTEDEIENDDGFMQEGVIAVCTRCDHETTSFGTSDASIRRCMVLLREECPNGESNFYVDSRDD